MSVTSQRFILFFTVLIAAWLMLFWQGIVAMESIWSRSDTFAHGYFILPISIWLVYRDRAYLSSATASPASLALIPLLGSCFVWLFAYAADINVLMQVATVVSLVSIIWLCAGNKLTWRYKFPLAYLMFAVPMGENFIPALQDITAWITVFLLKIHGIPVFRDGWYIQIPTGMFEVAVACSGIRYLIASMAVGTLFAYLSYNSFKKQIIFIIFSFVLPIIANGIRAYLIVIIAHYSDMKYATGADHLVYGWIFFGFVIMLMFWIGGKFADPEQDRSLANDDNAIQKPNNKPLSLVVFAAALIVGTWFIQKAIPVFQVSEQSRIEVPTLVNVQQSSWGITFQKPLVSAHAELKSSAEVFYAKYGNKQSIGELINHANKLYDHDTWTIVDRVSFDFDGHKARFLLLRNINGLERGLIYWYQVGPATFVDPTMTKLYQAYSLLTGQAEFAEIIAFSSDELTGKKPIEKLKAIAEIGKKKIEAIR